MLEDAAIEQLSVQLIVTSAFDFATPDAVNAAIEQLSVRWTRASVFNYKWGLVAPNSLRDKFEW